MFHQRFFASFQRTRSESFKSSLTAHGHVGARDAISHV